MSRSVVLVTGGARRIGRAIALDLAAAGWSVAFSYRHSFDEAQDTLRELRRNPGQAEALFADLSDEASCRALVPEVVKRFGRIDAVVNNASTFEYDNAETCGLAAMELHWKANTAPAILLAQGLYQYLKEAGCTGCVVNLLDRSEVVESESRLFFVHPVQGGAGCGDQDAGHGHGTAAACEWSGSRFDTAVRTDERAGV